jgi:hypothetical protein
MLLRVTRALLKLMRRNARQGRVLRIVVGQPVLMVLRIVHNRKKNSERIDDRVEGSIQYWYCVTTNPTSFPKYRSTQLVSHSQPEFAFV